MQRPLSSAGLGETMSVQHLGEGGNLHETKKGAEGAQGLAEGHTLSTRPRRAHGKAGVLNAGGLWPGPPARKTLHQQMSLQSLRSTKRQRENMPCSWPTITRQHALSIYDSDGLAGGLPPWFLFTCFVTVFILFSNSLGD